MAFNTVPSKQTHSATNNSSGNTSGPYAISFDYLDQADIQVTVNGVLKTRNTHYTFPTKAQIEFTANNFPTLNEVIEIKRNTNITLPKVDFEDGSVLTESDLDNNSKHILFGMQETKSDVESLISTFVSSSAPTDVSNGARWFDTVSGRTFVYYVDTDSAQWIEANPPFGVGDLSNVNISNLTNNNIASNAAIAQSKLDLSITNSEINSNAAIAKSKLANLDIVNADVNASAAIDASKIVYANSASGGQVRTLESRLDSIININDFIPAGTTTSTTNCAGFINNAINALPATGGKIIFPSGLYKLTSAITITKNAVVLEGACGMVVNSDNYGARFKRDDNDNNTFISITNARSIEIRNIGFIGGTVNNQNTGGAGVKPPNGAIHVVAQPGTQEHIYENLHFHGITFCMNFDGLSSSMIRNCKFRSIPETSSGESHVIKLHGSSSTDRIDQIRIVDCIIDGSPAAGISVGADWGAGTAYGVGNKVLNDRERVYECISAGTAASSGNGPTGTGQSISDGSVTWKWIGNKINQSVRGVYIDADVSTVFISRTSVIRCRDNYYVTGTWDGNFINFENAEAERAAYDGFNINGTGNFITIADCFAGTNYDQGINIGTSQNSTVQISNVNARDNRKNGILINSPTQNVSISNPTIGGNGSSQSNYYHGISIASSTNHVYISGGKCGGGTVDLSGTGPQKYGIQVNGNNHDHIVIIGVDVSGNQTGGIEWLTDNGSGNVNASNDNFIQFCAGYSTGQTTFP